MGLTVGSVLRRIAQGNNIPEIVRAVAENSDTSVSCTSPVSLDIDETSKIREASKIGRGIVGQNSYPVAHDTDPELWKWNQIITKAAIEEGLDPFDVIYWVCKRDLMMQAAARNGFPANIPHWKNGMEFYELTMQHRYRLAKIYEMIINNNPLHAYLMEGNELYDQKLVMCHCMGHSDFFKNNLWFKNTNKNMMNRIAEHGAYIRKALDEEGVPFLEMEKFLEKSFSIEGLIDTSNTSPRQLSFELIQTKEAAKIPDDFGVIESDDLPSHMRKRLNDPERIRTDREQEKKRLEEESRKTPRHPDRDVLGYIIENSTVLKPWQRQVLMHIREQSYYFAPQAMTKIMNEGWAVYWHQKLMCRPDIKELKHIAAVADHNSVTLAMGGGSINPYTIGFTIFKDIEERWNKGQHGTEWERIEDREERKRYDTKEMKGKEKIFEVRKWDNDAEFIRKYLTQELAEELKLFAWDKHGDSYVIASRKFEDVKQRLIQMLENGGRPIIEVHDGNYENRGELLLEHVYAYDLKRDYAQETLKNILRMWGRPVHLNTQLTLEGNKQTPIRITVEYSRTMAGMVPKPVIKTSYYKLYKSKDADGIERWYPAKDAVHEVKEDIT